MIEIKIFKSLTIILLCVSVSNCKLFKLSIDESKNTASSILDMIDKFFIKGFRQFDIKIYGKISLNLHDVISEVGRGVNENFSVKIYHHQTVNETNCNFQRSALILLSEKKTLEKIIKFSKLTNYFARSLRFLIYCDEWNNNHHSLEIFNFAHLSHGHFVNHMYIVINSKGLINLMTLKYFTESSCYKPKLQIVDKFNTTSQKWQKNVKKIENGRQFYGCMVTILLLDSARKSIERIMGEKWSGRNSVKSFESENFLQYSLHESIAKIGNFTPNYQVYTIRQIPKKLTLEREFIPNKQGIIIKDCFVYYVISYEPNNQKENFLQPMTISQFFAALTPSELYTNWEKVFFPFDMTSWILFGLIFTIVFLAIFIINLLSRETKNVIFGRGMKNVAYNAIGAFFGIAQKILPSENCPRILIAFFIYFCLVFRTCYQGQMFDFMTTNMRKPSPTTIEDLVSQNYSFVYPYELKDPNGKII